MIDLHCHILPGLDDGAADMDESLAMARAAVEAGTRTVAATPHIREEFPFDPAELPERTDELRSTLSEAGIDLEITPGGEIAIAELSRLSDDALAGLCLGEGVYLLVESPYRHALGWLEEGVLDVQARGFRPILAHPERCPAFQQDPDRLAELVEHGVLVSLTAASLEGRFGRRIREFSLTLLERGLAHNVASDAHDARIRGPALAAGLSSASGAIRKLERYIPWYTAEVPGAILAGNHPPGEPPKLRRAGALTRSAARFARR